MKKELPLFTAWLAVVSTVLERARRFPKGLRPTLGNRLIDRAMEVLEGVVELRYTRQRTRLFRDTNISIEKLRILVRLCFEHQLLSMEQYRDLAERMDQCGRMLGGWRRSSEETGK